MDGAEALCALQLDAPPGGDPQPVLVIVHKEDVDTGRTIRVFESTPETADALMGETLLESRDLQVIEEYECVEAMLSSGWTVDY